MQGSHITQITTFEQNLTAETSNAPSTQPQHYTDKKKLPAFMVYVLVSQELGPIFQVNPRDMRSY